MREILAAVATDENTKPTGRPVPLSTWRLARGEATRTEEGSLALRWRLSVDKSLGLDGASALRVA